MSDTVTEFDRTLPPLLDALNQLERPEHLDFEPYEHFMSASDNQAWIRAWTGNKTLNGGEYRVFGEDGTGGYAAFWLVRPGADLLAQPIVFFGSEGELGIVAENFADYLWLLAGGVGPYEAIEYKGEGVEPFPDHQAFAAEHAPGARKSPSEVIAAARERYPDFVTNVRALTA
jgi:hypothetical protein